LRAIKVRASPGQRETLTSCFYKDSFTADKLSRLVEMKTTAMVLVLAMSSIIGFSQHALGASSTNVEEYTAKYPYVFHLIQKSMWEEALANDATYYPPTYSHDKFSHATANPDFLMIIGNHFYPEVAGEWLCLRMSIDSLHASVSTYSRRYSSVCCVGSARRITRRARHILGGGWHSGG
jgi:hypothetical protein